MLKKLTSTKFMMLALVMSVILVLAACGDSNNDSNANDNSNNGDSDNGDMELGDKDLSIPYVAWAGSTSRSPVLAKALEEVGYNVEVDQVEAGPMWTSVADDEDTLMATAWLPTTHEEYMDEYEDDVEVYDTPLIDKAPLALTVPEYMDVDSIEDLKDNDEVGDAVDWTITGIDPGAGIMNSTEKAMEEYDLEDEWDLQESSESAMISTLQEKYENEEPIIITGWKPHWIFADMDLKMLDDPKEVYGGDGDEIDLVFNKDFKDAHPAAHEIATRWADDWSEDDEDELMTPIFVDDEDEEKVAEDFIDEHQDRVDEWTEGIDKE